LIRTFIKSVDLSNDNTIQRDLDILEKDVNSFKQRGDVTPVKIELEIFSDSGTFYFVYSLEYDQANR